MAYHGRYDGQVRDRETSRYGRDVRDTRDESGFWRGGDRSAFGNRWRNDGRGDWRDVRDDGRTGRDRSHGRDRHYGYDDRHDDLPIDETGRLIASNKVEGTAVYGRDGYRLGSIYNFMVDKRSGRVEYAVMSYGGFLGMGTRYFPLPWDILSYDTRFGGYRVEMVERDLERAPSFDRDSEPNFDTSYGRQVRGWYGLGY